MALSTAESKFLWAIRQQESGGNYSASNSIGAMGAYQILSSNLASWEKEAGLPIETGTQFLNDKTEQDNLAIYKLGGYYNKYGDAGAAAMWYSGQPDPTKTYGSPPVSQYVSEVVGRESQAPANGIGTAGTVSGGTSSGGTVVPAISNPLTNPLDSVMGLFGLTDVKDALQRLGLILLGGLFIIVAVVKFTDMGASVAAKAKTAAKASVV